MSPARFRWGLFLILIGVLFLLNNLNVIAWWVWADILALWPLLLIAIGIEKIFTKTRLQAIAYLAPVALAAIVLYVAIGGINDESGISRSGDRTSYRVSFDEAVSQVAATLSLKNHDLTLRGSHDELVEAYFRGLLRKPRIDHEIKDGAATISLDARSMGQWFGHSNRSGDIEVDLSNRVPIRLSCDGEGADMRLDCRDLKVSDLAVESEDGNIRILLGSLFDKVQVSLAGEDADFKLRVPPGAGLRISGAGEELAGFMSRIGLIESGSIFMSSGYDTLKPQIDLELKSHISQLSVDYY